MALAELAEEAGKLGANAVVGIDLDYETIGTGGSMGTFDAGEFTVRGAVTIDFDSCTITDEKNADVVFGDKVVWGA